MTKRKIQNNTDIDSEYDEVADDEEEGRRTNWLIPLLIIPVFFVLGWLANDFARTNPSAQNLEQQYGVGGGPGDVISPSVYQYSPTGSSGDILLNPTITPEPTMVPTTSTTE